ncbi:HIT family protein [Candidatus Acetothermia bacterium]|jgi:histidine triad (HIT) family protein|nr:HIT family protein [Candidatus Acetothermia bacterium]MCI2431236.1 HIT family protein [Candidatus Acetothermia bacterium]MCI2436849.1 HIT family protein [Candidatus Acetothermia bacterium]
MTDCIFCQIVRGERSAYKVYEDAETLAFLDLFPLVEGHTLVIPKAHYIRLQDLNPDLTARVAQAVRAVTEKLEKAFSAPATTIGINNGPAAGQVVPHLHVHILPRYENDGGGTVHSIVRTSPKRSLEEICNLIAKSR